MIDCHLHNVHYLQWFFVPPVRRLLSSLEVEGGGVGVGSKAELGWRERKREGRRRDWTGVGCAVDCAES